MRRSIRTLFVCLLVALVVYQPALACRSCGGRGGGNRAPVYYGHGPVVYNGDCGGCGHQTVVYDSGCGGCGPCDGEDAAMSERSPTAPSDAMRAPAKEPTPMTTVAPPIEPPLTPPPAEPMAPPLEATPAPALPAAPPAEVPPPAATEPAPPAATAPAEPLFGNEPAAAPPAAMPPETPPAATPTPATPPAATPPAEKASDDLFGGSTEKSDASTPPASATPPAATPPAATPPAATPPAASPSDDLFGPSTKEEPKAGSTTTTTQKPAEQPADSEAKPAEPPAAAPASEDKSKPADSDKKDEKKAEEKDPLFGTVPNVLHEAGGLASGELRLWTDNTGNFSCRGRLVRFQEGQVRLLKENGRTTTVPLARLSTGDLEFVNRQASAQQAEVGKTAQSPAMIPSLTN